MRTLGKVDALQAYAVLDVRPGAPAWLLRRQYRRLAKMWHPDKFADNPVAQSVALRWMQEINEAHRILQDHARVRTSSSRPAGPSSPRADPTDRRSSVLRQYAAAGHAFDLLWEWISGLWIVVNLVALAVALVFLTVALFRRDFEAVRSQPDALIFVALLVIWVIRHYAKGPSGEESDGSRRTTGINEADKARPG